MTNSWPAAGQDETWLPEAVGRKATSRWAASLPVMHQSTVRLMVLPGGPVQGLQATLKPAAVTSAWPRRAKPNVRADKAAMKMNALIFKLFPHTCERLKYTY